MHLHVVMLCGKWLLHVNYYQLDLKFYNFLLRDQDIVILNQSLRILSNIVAAGAISSSGIIDEVLTELLAFTSTTVKLKLSDGIDLIPKVNQLPVL